MAVNWKGAGTGALSGAGAGAPFGPWGALGGALLGGGIGLLSGGAENDSLKKIPTRTKEQEALHRNILAQAMGMNENGGGYNQSQDYYKSLLQPGNEAYQNFAAPYMDQFQNEIVPQIAERFAGKGALSSSGFGQSLGAAGGNLQAQLAQLFSQLQSNAASSLTNQYNQLSQLGLGHEPFAYTRNEGTQGFGGSFGQGLSDNTEGILAGLMSLFKDKDALGVSNRQTTSRGISELFRRAESGGLS